MGRDIDVCPARGISSKLKKILDGRPKLYNRIAPLVKCLDHRRDYFIWVYIKCVNKTNSDLEGNVV